MSSQITARLMGDNPGSRSTWITARTGSGESADRGWFVNGRQDKQAPTLSDTKSF